MTSHCVQFRTGLSRLVGVAILAALIGGLPMAVAGKQKIDPAALKKAKAATVHIRVQYPDGDVSEGSGFVTSVRGMVVTNAHVVGMLDNDSQKPSKVEVTFNSGEPDSKTIVAAVGYVDGDSDLALLRYSTKDLKVVPDLLEGGYAAKLNETQDVFVVGFPLGKQAGSNVTVTATTVTSLRKEGTSIKHIQMNGGMHPGNSGGPVVDKDGKVVGIAVAAFAGTQLHLAIPTEALNSVLNGRITNSTFGVPYRDGDKIRLPFRFEKADPLGKMKAIAVETWMGKPGPVRPAVSKKPDPLPDDSPVTVLDVKPDAKGVFSGEMELDGNKDPKQVYWNRYQVSRGGEQVRWYPASVMNAGQAPAVDRKPANLKFAPPVDKTDLLGLTSDASFRIRFAGGGDTTLGMTVKGVLKETVTAKGNDGKWHKRVTYDGINTVLTQDKKPLEGAGQLLKVLRDGNRLASEIDLDKDGSVARHLIDYSKVPKASKDSLELVSDQVQMSLDSLAPPLPLKELSPAATWTGKQTYVLGALGMAVPAKAEVTYNCTFRDFPKTIG